MKNNNIRTELAWDDLPNRIAMLAELGDSITQCAIIAEGRQVAHLFLFNDNLLALTEVMFPDEDEPDNDTLLAIGRILVAQLRATRAGRKLT